MSAATQTPSTPVADGAPARVGAVMDVIKPTADSPPLPTSYMSKGSLEQLLAHAAYYKVSDVFIAGDEPITYSLNSRIVAVRAQSIRIDDAWSLLHQIYGSDTIRAGVNSGEPHDDSFETICDGKRVRWRLNVTATVKFGKGCVRLVIRRIDGKPPLWTDLGIEENLLKAATTIHNGLCIVSGPTGSGKSTTLAAMLRYRVEDPKDHIHLVTLESPIEYVYEGIKQANTVVTQIAIGKGVPSFARGVENALRQKPNVILVGEARDHETIGATVTAALTGHGVYTTAHDTGVANTIQRLVRAFPAEEREASTQDLITVLGVAMSQNLVPTTDGKRVAIREYLVFTEDMKDRLRNSTNLFLDTKALLEEYGRPMMRDVEKFYQEGRIDSHYFKLYQRLAEIGMKK